MKSITQYILFTFILLCPLVSPCQRIAVLGDSNTWLGGDNCGSQRGWTYWFGQEIRPESLRSYARSGATWTNTTATVANVDEDISVLGDNNVIYNQVLRLNADNKPSPDYIIIGAGTNDAWFSGKRPNAFAQSVEQAWGQNDNDVLNMEASEVTSLALSVRHNVLLLKQRHPKAHIVLLTPMQTTSAPTELIAQAGDIIEQCGKRLNCHVIRLDKESKVVAQNERRRKVYTSDGTHTSVRGAKSNGMLIATSLRNLFK